MTRLPIRTLIPLLLLLLSSATFAAPAGDMLTHASGDTFWISEVVSPTSKPSPSDHTFIWYRKTGSPDQWFTLADLQSRISAMGGYQNDLAVLLASGDFLFVRPNSTVTGRPLPNNARMLTLAGNHDSLYAVGLPTTRPTTNPNKPTPTPGAKRSDAPDSSHLTLYRLTGSTWTPQFPIPTEIIPTDKTPFDLSLIDGRPTLAVLRNKSLIQIHRLTPDNTWLSLGQIALPASPVLFSLLDNASRPLLWTAGPSGPGFLYLYNNGWSNPVALKLPDTIPPDSDRSVTVVAGHIRIIFVKKDKIWEHRYDAATGAPIGSLSEIRLPVPIADSPTSVLLQWAALILFVVIMFSSSRRQKPTKEISENLRKLTLAPRLPRLAAGAIDASPVLITIFLLGSRIRSLNDLGMVNVNQYMNTPEALIPWSIAVALYLLHTTLTELLTGRTLGKMLFGLRVVGLDGQPARPGPILLRNLLRIIDLMLPFALLLVLYLPLRQRVADIAANTLVITIHPKPAPPQDDSAEDDSF